MIVALIRPVPGWVTDEASAGGVDKSLAPSTTPDLETNRDVGMADVVQAARDSGAILQTEGDVGKPDCPRGFLPNTHTAYGIAQHTQRLAAVAM